MENAEKFFETYCDFVTKVKSDPSLNIEDLKKIKIGKIYTGTSNTSILEKEVIKYGIKNEIKVITFLDHYVKI